MTISPIFPDNISLEEQVKLLATFILFTFDGEPSNDSGAIECAAKLLAKQKDQIESLEIELREWVNKPAPTNDYISGGGWRR